MARIAQGDLACSLPTIVLDDIIDYLAYRPAMKFASCMYGEDILHMAEIS